MLSFIKTTKKELKDFKEIQKDLIKNFEELKMSNSLKHENHIARSLKNKECLEAQKERVRRRISNFYSK
ncbi:Uncharacterised protein [Streptococcus pneumoniae]|nr:Uncharacterised protein [Streptococcus pneumoniae]